ncbi:ebp domain-containing protein [Rutstroemia sp. NJR-2017a BBW]|nr:ebp domain-containing protein [Rutstroemia sp. NJR-2017a BBW]
MASIMENASIESAAAIVSHPYYPLEIEIASYLANEWTVHTLLTVFFGGCAVLFFCTRAFVARRYPNLPSSEKAAIWWLVLCYFSLNHTRMGESQELFGQLWKEYALSDSRYLTSDPFVLCMETVTAFLWGPMCFIVASFITTRNPLRHPLQIIVTVGQIYGLVLYYATHTFDFYYKEVIYSRPEFLYFWFYYFFMNFLWMIFPGMLLVDSVRTIAKAFTALDEINGTKGKDRDTKKLQ